MEERHAEGAMVEAISGAKPARQAILGDASNRNENSGNLASCLLVEGVLFRPPAIRYDVSPGHRGCDTPGSQKAPSAKRCIKTYPMRAKSPTTRSASEITERHKVH